jgi:hypothetical protein
MTTPLADSAPSRLLYLSHDDSDGHDRLLAPDQGYDQQGKRGGQRGKDCSWGGFGGRGGSNGSFGGGEGGHGGDGGPNGNGGPGGDAGSFGGGNGGHGGGAGSCEV